MCCIQQQHGLPRSVLLVTDVIQETDDQLTTGYNKFMISFQKIDFHNLS